MAAKFFGVVQGLPWIKSLTASKDDTHSDRLNHRYTVGYLLICASIVSSSPIFISRINCWVPAQFSGNYLTYTNNYCWISNTYYVPTNITVPHNINEREHAEIGYYQWAPFIFLVSALFFYFPRMLWRSMNIRSGIDIEHLNKKNNININVACIDTYCTSNENQNAIANRICRSLLCTHGKRLGNYLRSIYLIVKFLYLINSLIQLIFIHIILGQSGWFYGFDIWHKIFIQNSVLTDSPYFPRITLCDLRIREIGNLHRYTVQCVLPINMFNEKLFSLSWFLFIYVFIRNLFSFLNAVWDTIAAGHRKTFIQNLYRMSGSKSKFDQETLDNFTENFLMQDGVLIIDMIYCNGEPFHAAETVRLLLENDEKRLRERGIKKTRPQIPGSDV